MKLKFAALFILILIIASCSDDSNDNNPKSNDTLEEYYKQFCFGYNIGDTTGIKISSLSKIESDSEHVYISGTKNKSLCIYKFEEKSKNLVFKIIDTKPFVDNFSIDFGYGDIRSYDVEKISLENIFEIENGYAIITHLTTKAQDNMKPYEYRAYFIGENFSNNVVISIHKFLFNKWFKDSFIYCHEKNQYSILDNQGNLLNFGYYQSFVYTKVYPISYSSFLSTGLSSKKITVQKDLFRVDGETPTIPSISLCDIDTYDAKVDIKYSSKSDNIVTIYVDVTEYSGRKHSHKYDLDIEKFELL